MEAEVAPPTRLLHARKSGSPPSKQCRFLLSPLINRLLTLWTAMNVLLPRLLHYRRSLRHYCCRLLSTFCFEGCMGSPMLVFCEMSPFLIYYYSSRLCKCCFNPTPTSSCSQITPRFHVCRVQRKQQHAGLRAQRQPRPTLLNARPASDDTVTKALLQLTL
jgi:hypothetical protein